MKFDVITADCPWQFGDLLRQSDVKRGAAANYQTMSTKDLMALDVASIAAKDAVLALWCPASMLEDGFAVGRAWGFDKYVGLWTWVKLNPPSPRLQSLVQCFVKDPDDAAALLAHAGKLAFGMGHVFRGATEHALIFRRGKKLKVAEHRRNVYLGPALPHSQKPEALQDDLDAMYPTGERLELFARRWRESAVPWACTGLELDGRDVRVAIEEAKMWEESNGQG